MAFASLGAVSREVLCVVKAAVESLGWKGKHGGGESWRGRAPRSSALLPAPKQRHRAKPENGLGSDGAIAVSSGRNAIMGGSL